jgi:hypothetical protein
MRFDKFTRTQHAACHNIRTQLHHTFVNVNNLQKFLLKVPKYDPMKFVEEEEETPSVKSPQSPVVIIDNVNS